ncbi:CHAP domain-containing protein [Parerythrobacter aurantius]|uniref:CHAP domain-containing protein n=1 Tax=Parerythrobacter aurantius TaxID=3127706 RepID=UPI00324AE9BB
MKRTAKILAAMTVLAALGVVPEGIATARTVAVPIGTGGELPPYLQCAPYARSVSGIQIYGDAHTWWAQAEGRYARGRQPKPGAVMAFIPTERMQLGHVATVVRVIDARTVLLDHANWSPIDGRRGQVERGVKAVDVSERGDWSEVRVWYAPLQDLGTTRWPVAGFIYADGKASKATPDTRLAAAPRQAPQVSLSPPASAPLSAKPSRDFSKAFAGLGEPASPPAVKLEAGAGSAPARAALPPVQRKPVAGPRPAPQADPFAAVLAQYD